MIDRMIEVIVKIKKKIRGEGEVRVDVNEELKFFYQKKLGGVGMGGIQGESERRFEVFCENVKTIQGGCERRIEVIVELSGQVGDGGWSIGRGLVGSNVGGRGCCGVWGMRTKNRRYCTIYSLLP